MRSVDSKLTLKAPEQCCWRRSAVFAVNFEQILQIAFNVSIVEFEQVNRLVRIIIQINSAFEQREYTFI